MISPNSTLLFFNSGFCLNVYPPGNDHISPPVPETAFESMIFRRLLPFGGIRVFLCQWLTGKNCVFVDFPNI